MYGLINGKRIDGKSIAEIRSNAKRQRGKLFIYNDSGAESIYFGSARGKTSWSYDPRNEVEGQRPVMAAKIAPIAVFSVGAKVRKK